LGRSWVVRPDLAQERSEGAHVRPGALEMFCNLRQLLDQRVENLVELGVHAGVIVLVVDRVRI
jgi:hypothetical protein